MKVSKNLFTKPEITNCDNNDSNVSKTNIKIDNIADIL
jgi:hypothetical protein